MICQAIRDIENRLTAQEVTIDQLKGQVYELPPKSRSKLVKLIGEKCVLNCFLNGQSEEVLWDTGAQISALSAKWLKHCFPGESVRPLQDLLDGEVVIKSASGDRMDFEGWVELNLQLSLDSEPLKVSFFCD